jgi:DNA-binding MarR family transcriptional regulator
MPLQAELPLALRAAYLQLHRRTEACCAAHGVTADQFVLLATLARGQALTQRELARRMSSDPSTVRAMLVLLERLGLVRRQAHPTDARARTVELTAAGKRKFRKLWGASEAIRTEMWNALPGGAATEFVGNLQRLAETLGAADAEPNNPLSSSRNAPCPAS